jgi:hypothetical protein
VAKLSRLCPASHRTGDLTSSHTPGYRVIMTTIVKEVIKMEPIFTNWTGQSTNPDCFSLIETTSIDTLSYPKNKMSEISKASRIKSSKIS